MYEIDIKIDKYKLIKIHLVHNNNINTYFHVVLIT